MRLSRRQPAATFKRARNNKAISLKPAISTSYISVPKRDPNNPRTEKESDVFVANSFSPVTRYFGLRKDGFFTTLKSDSGMCSFKDMDDTSRSWIIKRIVALGCTPSAVVEDILHLPARMIGAIRRWHNGDWRNQTNQHIRREHSYNRV
jgi:hypothetical protein